MSEHSAEKDAPWHQHEALHWLVCPVRSRLRRRRYHQPFWRDDKTAHMLGIRRTGCRRCGRGCVVPSGSDNYTCPTACVEANHPGREHDDWLDTRVFPPAVNRCDWGQCDREPEPAGSAFCTYHADEWERVQQAKADEWWAE